MRQSSGVGGVAAAGTGWIIARLFSAAVPQAPDHQHQGDDDQHFDQSSHDASY
jgi:hypothetical protein